MTFIDTRPIRTIGDLKQALSEFPDDSRFEVVWEPQTGTVTAGTISSFGAIHQAMRPNEGAIVEIVAVERLKEE